MLKARELPPSWWTCGGRRVDVPPMQREQQGRVNRHVLLITCRLAIYWLPFCRSLTSFQLIIDLLPCRGGSSRHHRTKPLCKSLTVRARWHLQRLDRFLRPHANVRRGSWGWWPSHRHRCLVKPLGIIPDSPLPCQPARRFLHFPACL